MYAEKRLTYWRYRHGQQEDRHDLSNSGSRRRRTGCERPRITKPDHVPGRRDGRARERGEGQRWPHVPCDGDRYCRQEVAPAVAGCRCVLCRRQRVREHHRRGRDRQAVDQVECLQQGRSEKLPSLPQNRPGGGYDERAHRKGHDSRQPHRQLRALLVMGDGNQRAHRPDQEVASTPRQTPYKICTTCTGFCYC